MQSAKLNSCWPFPFLSVEGEVGKPKDIDGFYFRNNETFMSDFFNGFRRIAPSLASRLPQI